MVCEIPNGEEVKIIALKMIHAQIEHKLGSGWVGAKNLRPHWMSPVVCNVGECPRTNLEETRFSESGNDGDCPKTNLEEARVSELDNVGDCPRTNLEETRIAQPGHKIVTLSP